MLISFENTKRCLIILFFPPSDFVLTYKDKVEGKKKSEEEIEKSSERRRQKRDAFFENLKKKHMTFEIQEPKVSTD